ncbi:MAG TPA: SurA N-terminal domain-containing protein, partial [Anaerolineae bacterium]|nr:SurA N-terminal domain-containing protein [Anaerolineae bacterium]
MLKTLRSNTKWIMITVSLCFIGMIIFAWGMDITGRRSGMSAGILGRINGEKIPYTLYDNLVKSQRQMYSENTRITLAQERRIYDEVWDYIVNQTLIAHDIKKYNISYTDQELVQFMLNNPIQLAYQIPMFQENNAFSLTKYQDFLKNPANLQNPQNAQLLIY